MAKTFKPLKRGEVREFLAGMSNRRFVSATDSHGQRVVVEVPPLPSPKAVDPYLSFLFSAADPGSDVKVTKHLGKPRRR